MAVSKATDDLANSESLKLARVYDPKGNRTIGVITQLDLLEEGQDVLNDLQNLTYPLRLGNVSIFKRERLRWRGYEGAKPAANQGYRGIIGGGS